MSNQHFPRRTRQSFTFKASSIINVVDVAIILAFVIFAYELRTFASMVRVENGSDGQVEQLTLKEGQNIDLDVDHKS